LIFWLVSGGGSALTGGRGVRDHLTLDSMREAIQWLLDSGADIVQGTSNSVFIFLRMLTIEKPF